MQAISVNVDRLDNKQMNEIMPYQRPIGTNLIFQRYRFRKNGRANN